MNGISQQMQLEFTAGVADLDDNGVRLQEFVMRDFRAAGPELHHVHDVERQPSQLRQAPGKPRLAARGISEHRHLFHE